MRTKDTGIYDSPIPENEADLSRLFDLGVPTARFFDLGGVPNFPNLIVRAEHRAMEILEQHGVIDDSFRKPHPHTSVGKPHPSVAITPGEIDKVTGVWRQTGPREQVAAEFRHIDNPATLKVPIDSPPEVFDARALLMAIVVYGHQKILVAKLSERLATRKNKSQKSRRSTSVSLADIDRAVEVLCSHAVKITDLAARLSVHVQYAASSRESAKTRAENSADLDVATDATVRAAVADHEGKSISYIVRQVLRRMEQNPEITALLARMNRPLPSDSNLWKKIKALRAKK